MIRFFFGFLVLGFVTPLLAHAETLGATEALALMKKKVVNGNADKLQVRAVKGCYPVAEGPATDFVCLVDMNGPDGEFRVMELGFRKSGKGWEMLDPDGSFDPKCPGTADAEKLFQSKLNDSKLRVTDVPDDGVFTDTRGKFRDKSGPHKLMCAYTIDRSGGEATAVAYFTYDDGRYAMDEQPELWDE